MQEFNEAEMFRAVLNEMLEELKQLNTGMKEMKKTVADQNEKIDGFHQRLENLQVIAPLPDLQPLKDQVTDGISGISRQLRESMEGVQSVFSQHLEKLTAALEAQPKPIVRRISLFPENDYQGHFKFFIVRFFLWTLGVCLFLVLLELGHEYIDQRTSFRGASSNGFNSYSGGQAAPPVSVSPPRHSSKKSRRRRTVDSAANAVVVPDSSVVIGGGDSTSHAKGQPE